MFVKGHDAQKNRINIKKMYKNIILTSKDDYYKALLNLL